LDHVSASWSIDETLSVTENNTTEDVTVQWSFITESLNDSCHDKGEHGMGSILGGDMEKYQGITVHHSLYAHHRNRSPKFASESTPPAPPIFDFRNNVVYNWVTNPAYTSSDQCSMINYVGNYLKYGPNTPDSKKYIAVASGGVGTNIYQNGNYIFGKGYLGWDIVSGSVTRLFSPIPVYPVNTTDALTAYNRVLAEAGASLPKRDAVDQRVANTVRNGTGGIIDSQSQVGGWPALDPGIPLADADVDGMPDSWEIKYGLNPNNFSDNVIDTDNDGYLNIEEYLNSTIPAHIVPSSTPPPEFRDFLVNWGTDSSGQDKNSDGLVNGVDFGEAKC
jgi:hypothetical protein